MCRGPPGGEAADVYPAWFFLHVFVILLVAGALLGAAILAGRPAGRSRGAAAAALALVAGALLLVPAQVGLLFALGSYGPDFALERLPLGIPLALVGLVAAAALPGLARAARGEPADRTAGAAAVRVALVAVLLSWHLVLVPPTSSAAVLGTGAAYAAVLLLATVLPRPGRRRLVRVLGAGVVAVLGVGLTAGAADRANRLPASTHAGHAELRAGQVDNATLRGPQGPADREVTLTARRVGDRWTYDGTVPGPELRFTEGELVAVTLVNSDVPAGVTLHWHGLDVPNAEDGVAGVTQDAVRPGERHVYRFRPDQVGTFWYHSHQVSSEQVARGLAGVVVIEPRGGIRGLDLALLDHPRSDGSGPDRREVAPGTPVRLRLVNADDDEVRFAPAGTPFRVVAIDGTALARPAEVRGTRVEVTAGGRYDLAFTMPDHPVALYGGRRRLELRPPGDTAGLPRDEGRGILDPLSYGTPGGAPWDRDTLVDREHRLVLDQRMAFGGHGFGYQWAMNGQVWPAGPVVTVAAGDLVRTTIVNRSTANHPMHLHGHHSLVVSRGGEPATGTPWWTDTLLVRPGETVQVMFRADNPGIWMDHCHNLAHARSGFVLHLAYEGVGTSFRIGTDSGNAPE